MEYTTTARTDPAGGVAYYVYSITQDCIVSGPLPREDARRLMKELNFGASTARLRAKGFEAIKAFFREHRVSPKHRKKYDFHVSEGGLEIVAKDGERWRVAESEGEFVFLAMMPKRDTGTMLGYGEPKQCQD